MKNESLAAVTINRFDAIQRPNESWHQMVIRPVPHRVSAAFGSQVIAETRAALRVKELGHDIYDSVVYFPRASVTMALLERNTKTSTCPLKGNAIYFDLVVGKVRIENAAWSYVDMLKFDDRLAALKGMIGFDVTKVLLVEYSNGDFLGGGL